MPGAAQGAAHKAKERHKVPGTRRTPSPPAQGRHKVLDSRLRDSVENANQWRSLELQELFNRPPDLSGPASTTGPPAGLGPRGQDDSCCFLVVFGVFGCFWLFLGGWGEDLPIRRRNGPSYSWAENQRF